jgi:hypothetical protein
LTGYPGIYPAVYASGGLSDEDIQDLSQRTQPGGEIPKEFQMQGDEVEIERKESVAPPAKEEVLGCLQRKLAQVH